jgi:hypothetical protein
MIQAGIALSGPAGSSGINFIEIVRIPLELASLRQHRIELPAELCTSALVRSLKVRPPRPQSQRSYGQPVDQIAPRVELPDVGVAFVALDRERHDHCIIQAIVGPSNEEPWAQAKPKAS